MVIPGSTDTMADVMEIAPIVRRTMDIAMAAGIMGTITHTVVSSEETNAAGVGIENGVIKKNIMD